MKEESWRKIMEEKPWRRSHGGQITEDKPWRRNNCAETMQEKSWRREIMEEK